jgi:hypothetical protein
MIEDANVLLLELSCTSSSLEPDFQAASLLPSNKSSQSPFTKNMHTDSNERLMIVIIVIKRFQ